MPGRKAAVGGGSARAVVVLGDIPATGHIPDAQALRGPALASPDEVAPEFLDLVVRNLPASSERMLVVYPRWQAEPAKRLIRLTRGMLDTDQVASVGLDLPPLACSVVADLLSLAAPHLDVGRLAGLAARMRDVVLSGARVATVARLEHIDTKLTQHMASYSPGSGFLAWATPQGRIDRISRRRPLTPTGFRPAGPVRLLVAAYGTDFPEFEKELGASLRPDSVEKVPAQPLGATFWGTRKHVEFVAFCAHPQALYDIVRSTRYWTCRWCRQSTSLDICAVCGMFQETEATVSGRVPEAVGASAGGPSRTPGPDASRGNVPAGHRPALPAPPVFLTPQIAPPWSAFPWAPPGQTPPGQTPPGQTPPGQTPPGQTPRAQTPPAQTPPRQTPPAQTAPAPQTVRGGGPATSAAPGPAPYTAQGVPVPGRGRNDDRAVPFGKGAPVNGPAANGSLPPERRPAARARPAGPAAPARQDQQAQQEKSP